MRNREELLERRRKQRARQKKLRPPKPPKPPPSTDDAKAKARALNKLACDKYRASHLEQVRAINRDYYYRHRERLNQQQRDRRARAKQQKQSPFRALRALADVCSVRLLELEHGYVRIEPAPEKKAGPRKEQNQLKAVSAATKGVLGWYGASEGQAQSALPRAYDPLERDRGVRGLQSQKICRVYATLLQPAPRQARRNSAQESCAKQGMD